MSSYDNTKTQKLAEQLILNLIALAGFDEEQPLMK